MRSSRAASRRAFLEWLGGSSLALGLGGAAPLALSACTTTARRAPGHAVPRAASDAHSLFDLERAASARLEPEAFAYLQGGADDERTLFANRAAFERVGIRARRLVDVSSVDTTVELLGERLPAPILLAPVGFQEVFHREAEAPAARAAATAGLRMIASSVSTLPVERIAAAGGVAPWFQLYPTPVRRVTDLLLRRAESAGCTTVFLTVDTPAIGNRERHREMLQRMLAGTRKGNFDGLPDVPPETPIIDPSLTWDFVTWLRSKTRMRIGLKGIVTAEDAELAARHGVDAVIVSNHGARQLESDRATFDCLPEVVAAVDGRLPVLVDGGFRRGTDAFKALALGASAVCIGRPYCWGLGAFGEEGVAAALAILVRELALDMQLAGTPTIAAIGPSSVT